MKKGFTLIELLAVILILALIALIIMPVVSNVIEAAGKSAYKETVGQLISATGNVKAQYVIENNNDIPLPQSFICDGTKCSNGNYDLEIKGKVPESGLLYIDTDNTIYADQVFNGTYCASGTLQSMRVDKDCENLAFKITYDLDGGEGTNPTTVSMFTPAFTLTAPTKEGYGFVGWTGSNGTTPQTDVTVENARGDLHYTANWIKAFSSLTAAEKVAAIGEEVNYSVEWYGTTVSSWKILYYSGSNAILISGVRLSNPSNYCSESGPGSNVSNVSLPGVLNGTPNISSLGAYARAAASWGVMHDSMYAAGLRGCNSSATSDCDGIHYRAVSNNENISGSDRNGVYFGAVPYLVGPTRGNSYATIYKQYIGHNNNCGVALRPIIYLSGDHLVKNADRWDIR